VSESSEAHCMGVLFVVKKDKLLLILILIGRPLLRMHSEFQVQKPQYYKRDVKYTFRTLSAFKKERMLPYCQIHKAGLL